MKLTHIALAGLLLSSGLPAQTTTSPTTVDSTAQGIITALQGLLQALGCMATTPPVVTPPVVTPPVVTPPVVTPPAIASNISAVWANEGGDKVSQDELRTTNKVENKTGTVLNRAWDGTTIHLVAARNEVVSFNLVLEAGLSAATNVKVSFDTLTGTSGFNIASKAVTGNGVFDWTNRNIELFYARYVQIKGLSFFGYYKGDERQIPTRLQAASHAWADRPDHDKMYPDALVPLELVPTFTIAQGQNQSIFADVYVPKSAPPGTYTGSVTVTENGATTRSIPVSLVVQGFTLPDVPAAKAFMNLDALDIVKRYVNPNSYVNWASADGAHAVKVTDKYYQLFHRHKISLIGDNDCPVADKPCDTSMPRLNGSLFTAGNGYDGPGVNVGNDIYSIGTYGTWGAGAYGIAPWKSDQSLFTQHIDSWQSWFNQNLPNTEHFIYLMDEPSGSQVPQVQTWANWVNNDSGPGKDLLTMSTYSAVAAMKDMPDVDVPVTPGGIGGCPSGVSICDNTAATNTAASYYSHTPGKRFWYYNDGRPGTGTFMTEADGTDPRTLPWAQSKLGIQRWFYWFANVGCCGDYYKNALTWGSYNRFDNTLGWTGDDGTSNGNGLVIYPGTDLANPSSSYGVDGPVASLRLKEYRRGLQDADYIAIARQIDPAATSVIVNAAIPKAIWENPAPGGDPSYFLGPISWSSNPDDWETKRTQLATIIAAGCAKNPAAVYCQ